MNRLVGQKQLARTSSTPGRTQAVNYFLINRRFYFVDLPGYGFAKASKEARRQWAELLGHYFEETGPRLLIQLIDGKVGATRLDREAREYLQSLALEPVTVATKIDKVPKGQHLGAQLAIQKELGLPPDESPVLFSAISGQGAQQLWQIILTFLDNYQGRPRVRKT